MITVRPPSLKRQLARKEALAWTWLDGAEYALVGPECERWLHIYSGETWLCSGQVAHRRVKRTDGQQVFLLSQWEFDGRTLAVHAGRLCCKMAPRALTLWEQDGKRLAFWLPAGQKGVLREGLTGDMVPVVFGIILATGHDFWHSCD